MRERSFAVLGATTTGARVLDLFAGTGAVGIEALSRGAASAVFVEAHRTAAQLVKDNLESLGVGRDRGLVMNRTAARAVTDLEGRGRIFDLVWADPPFETWTDGLDALVAAVEAGLTTDGATLCLECPTRADLEAGLPDGLVVERDLKGGASRVVILRRK
jgi:16S rRNA (guanine966-N2)-methyltransferase